MTAMAVLLVGSGTLAASSLAVLARHAWVRWRAPKILVPEYRSGRSLELEREILGEPPSVPRSPQSIQGAAQADQNSNAGAAKPDFRASSAPHPEEPSLLGAMVDGAVPAAEYLWTWSKVDEHLFPAIGQLTHEHVENMADLGRAIQHWNSVSQWSEPNAALVAKVKGHLAEWVAADHLQLAGHSVDMPMISTQPGWDLDVDSVHVNVKLVDHFSSLGKHFAEYPDIPVLVPHDTVDIPEGAIHFDGSHAIDFMAAKEAGATVFVDDALSNLDLTDSADAGLEVGSGHVDFHIPWITMGISAFREGKILWKGNTDIKRACKNVAVDTTAVGGGGALGAKAGAAIGTAIAPGIGTAIGAAIGAIGGAIFGRKVANSVKRVPLENAKSAYDRALDAYESNQERTTAEADRQWTVERARQAAVVKRIAEQAEQEAAATIEKASASLEAARRLSPECAQSMLAATEATIQQRIQILESRSAGVSPLRRLFWPSAQFISDQRALPRYREFQEIWCAKRKTLKVSDCEPRQMHQVLDLIMPLEQGETLVRQFMVNIGRKRTEAVAKAEFARAKAIKAVAEARTNALETFNNLKDRLARWINSEMTPFVNSLRVTQNELISEMRKAGIEC